MVSPAAEEEGTTSVIAWYDKEKRRDVTWAGVRIYSFI